MNCVEIILALCKQRKIAISKVERDLHFGNSYFKNRKSKSIPGDRLTKIADYFGVSVNFLLGTTPESYLLWTQYSLAEAEKSYETEKDEEKRYELEQQIAILRESLEDQLLRIALLPQKDAAPEDGAGDTAESAAEFIRLFRKAPPWLQDQVLALLRAAESQREAADSDSTWQPAP